MALSRYVTFVKFIDDSVLVASGVAASLGVQGGHLHSPITSEILGQDVKIQLFHECSYIHEKSLKCF